jgi:CTP synthase (UTP-ammonia lyase)
MQPVRVGLIGDFQECVVAHQAIPASLQIAGSVIGRDIEATWLPTDDLGKPAVVDLDRFDAFWSVPASPYRSLEGAIRAIKYAREQKRPFLGTCGGYQHAVLEYATNVLGHREAEHAELNPGATVPLFGLLACSLVEVGGRIHFTPNSRLAGIYGTTSAIERYHCRYGMNPAYLHWFARSDLAVTGLDEEGDPRAFELGGHPFFFGTAYQPERLGLTGQAHPLVVAFAEAMTKRS